MSWVELDVSQENENNKNCSGCDCSVIECQFQNKNYCIDCFNKIKLEFLKYQPQLDLEIVKDN